MRIDEFGCENKQIVVMIHGLAMSWRMFWPSIGLLARNFHVLAVTVPGHDQADGSEFSSVEEIAARADLVRGGVLPARAADETDPLVKQAISTYVKAEFGLDNDDADKYRASFRSQKIALSMASEYIEPTEEV